MAKTKTLFVCQECGAQKPRWEGKCHECGAWNSFVEEISTPVSGKHAGRGWNIGSQEQNQTLKAHKLSDPIESSNVIRQSTKIGELDRVLGGGLVPGSYTLLGGDPGIGKSTLLLQMAGGLAKNQIEVLYVSGEESVAQTSLRAGRLGIKDSNIQIASESRLENIMLLAQQVQPQVLVVDSIQTIYLSEISSAPGSVSQVRECASQLMGLAKGSNMSVLLIGHVTKDGNIAGPKVLEHMVDTVLSFEGDGNYHFRLLRALKNRFGATNELGVFTMDSQGMKEVTNPSELFLEERGAELVGSSVFSAMEGSRPLLCEVQALANYSPMAMPRRTSIGFDVNRVHLLTAVLDKQLNANLNQNDIFVNVVGGLKLTEPSADLAVAASILSTAGQKNIDPRTCFFGEIGLTGEVRASSFAEERIREAIKLGFTTFVVPESNRRHLKTYTNDKDNKFIYIKNVRDLKNLIGFSKSQIKTKNKNQNNDEIDQYF